MIALSDQLLSHPEMACHIKNEVFKDNVLRELSILRLELMRPHRIQDQHVLKTDLVDPGLMQLHS